MRNEVLSTLLLAILLGALVYLGCEQVLLSRKMLVRLEAATEIMDMTRTTSWRWNDNGTIKVHTVTSTFQEHPFETETQAEFRARHDAKCDADEAIYPPIVN